MSLAGANTNITATIKDLAIIRLGNTDDFGITIFSARDYADVFNDDGLAQAVSTLEDVDGVFLFEEMAGGPRPEPPKNYYTFGLVFDISKYYPENCDLEVLMVQSKYNASSFGTIVHDKTKIIYLINFNGRAWNDDNFRETLKYTVRDVQTNEEAVGTIYHVSKKIRISMKCLLS